MGIKHRIAVQANEFYKEKEDRTKPISPYDFCIAVVSKGKELLVSYFLEDDNARASQLAVNA